MNIFHMNLYVLIPIPNVSINAMEFTNTERNALQSAQRSPSWNLGVTHFNQIASSSIILVIDSHKLHENIHF